MHKLPAVLPNATSETVFGRYVETAASDHGWLWMHVRPLPVPGARGRRKWITPATPGFPDYVMLHPNWPRLFVLELKDDDGKVAPDQAKWLRLFNRLECVDAWYARPEHWQRILAYLRAPADDQRLPL